MTDSIDSIKKTLQEHFTQGLVIIIGSGLSCAEGLPSMWTLAEHLYHIDPTSAGVRISKGAWDELINLIKTKGLEAALHEIHIEDHVAEYIRVEIVKCIRAPEQRIINEILSGTRKLKLEHLLPFLPSTPRLPIITTNYDRLIELSAELSGYGVDTKAFGLYHAEFSTKANKYTFCTDIVLSGPRKIRKIEGKIISLYKPHGSFDWTNVRGKPIRTAFNIEPKEMSIIAPGQDKYRAGYESPFDMQRELSNKCIDEATKFLIIGYGFNDNHLEVHLGQKIKAGTPTVLMTHTLSENAKEYIKSSSSIIAIEHDPTNKPGAIIHHNNNLIKLPGENIWDVEIFAKHVMGGGD